MPSAPEPADASAALRSIVDDLTLLWPTIQSGEQLSPAEIVGHEPHPGEAAAALFLWWTCISWRGLDQDQRNHLLSALVTGARVDGREFLAGFAAALRSLDFEPAGVREAAAQLRRPAAAMASAVVDRGIDVEAMIAGRTTLNTVLEYLTSAAWCLAAAERAESGRWLFSLTGGVGRWLPVEGSLDEFLMAAYRSGFPFLVSDPLLADWLPGTASKWLCPRATKDLAGVLPTRADLETPLEIGAGELADIAGRRLPIPESPAQASLVLGGSWCDEEEISVEGLLDDGAGRILPFELFGHNTLEDPEGERRYTCRTHTQAFIPDPVVEKAVCDTLLAAVALSLAETSRL